MPSWPDAALDRAGHLAAAQYNVARLPADAVTADLTTDAGQGHPQDARREPREQRVLGDVVRDVFGPARWLATGSGRGAESVVSSMVEAGQRVVANEVYVSGRWWIERFGGTVDDRPGLGHPGSVDGDGAVDPADVAYVQLTLPPAQLGVTAGVPVSIERVRSVRRWVDHDLRGVPLVIDASRAWENAAALGRDAREFFEVADIVLLSGSKDVGAGRGGLVVSRDDRWWPALAEGAAVLEGLDGGLGPAETQSLADGLAAIASAADHPRQRRIELLARELRSSGLAISSWNCGSVFLDPRAWLPDVPADELPAQALLAVVYLATGWRGLGTSTDEAGRAPIVRLAVRDDGPALSEGLLEVARLAGGLSSGLRSLPRDRSAPYMQPAAPVDPSIWPAVTSIANAPPHAWLVARPHRGRGPERALCDAFGRLAPGAALRTSNPTLMALHRRLGGGTGGPDTTVIQASTIDETQVRTEPRGAIAVIDVGARDRWLDAATTTDDVDVVWASTDQGGVLAVRRSSPLAAALDEASLFTMSLRLTPTDVDADRRAGRSCP
jgi:hypothetical protein